MRKQNEEYVIEKRKLMEVKIVKNGKKEEEIGKLEKWRKNNKNNNMKEKLKFLNEEKIDKNEEKRRKSKAMKGKKKMK